MKVKKWEYFVATAIFGETSAKAITDALAEYGRKGWELISVIPFYKDNEGQIIGTQFYFKRPLEQ